MHRYLFIFIIGIFTAAPNYAQTDAALWQQNKDLRLIDYDGGELLTLWRSEETARKLGSVLLLPDWGRLPTTPDVINPLRQQLPGLSWETIVLQPPLPEQNLDLIMSPEMDEAISSYLKSLVSALESVEQAKEEQFGYRLVIAQGMMASWILELYHQQLYSLPDALILIGSYQPEMTHNLKIAEQIAKFPKPLLDISFTSNNQWVRLGAPERLKAVTKQQKLNYRQLTLEGMPYHSETSQELTKSIYGWLSAIGWY